MSFKLYYFIFLIAFPMMAISQKNKKKSSPFSSSDVSSIAFRSIGPALTSGRISDIVVNPNDFNHWYVAAASGGLWTTKNHGITFQPIFDSYASYSIGCVKMAPSNTNVIWVGTGENNNQRSVSYGDGVYKSVDGGKSFKNMGLKNSEHIGNIIIHPEDENTLWVAAYGPLWSEGGDRGVYKTIDGGKTWKQTLSISKNTGISEIIMDPSNPSILYAAAHQRRRHEWTYIGGGPESGLYKSTDGGENWRIIENGLPKKYMGRIGLAVSAVDPNYVYAIVEARYGKEGFYRSTNKGESWSKMSSYKTSGNYYQEIFCDPKNRDKVFSMNTYLHHTEDGGKTFIKTGEKNKHVDNHAIWINPNNTNHWIVGCDGGIYETYSHAKEWNYYANLPLTQYYKVATDNSYPFFNVYGGTQDNNSMGGPSRTTNVAGIFNTDWFITNGGDGFETAIDWSNPNIVYAQAQYGWLVRYDKSTGEKVPIQPMPAKGEDPYRWNWDAPILVSPHDASTIYFASNKVFKSSNKGDDWSVISPDLSKQLDRNKLKVMGQVWSIDAVMKNMSTTIYGNIVAMDESPIKKGLIYAGTDDGLIQVTKNDGKDWMKIETFDGIPENTRVNMICASMHHEGEAFATFNNQRQGDFKPYLMKTSDFGKTWNSIAGDLPQRGTVYCVKQDHVDPNLLFVGTEFGAFFSINGGLNWVKLSGLPTISIYDLDIQKREDALVAASFGRGFYVIDNYGPLRELSKVNLKKEAHLFAIKESLQFIPSDPYGLRGTGFQGTNLWMAKNPKIGANIFLHIRDDYKTLKNQRQANEKKLEKDGADVNYPSFSDLRKEKLDENAMVIMVISDDSGNEIRKLSKKASKGIMKFNWNFRGASTNPITNKEVYDGFLVPPGVYYATAYIYANGDVRLLSEKKAFKVKTLNNQTIKYDANELILFRKQLSSINVGFTTITKEMNHFKSKLDLIKNALIKYPNTDKKYFQTINQLYETYDSCKLIIWGDDLKSKHQFETSPSLQNRFGMLKYKLSANMSGVTNTHKRDYAIIKEECSNLSVKLKLMIADLNAIHLSLKTIKDFPYIKE